MIKNFVKILELLGDRLEVCVSVYAHGIQTIISGAWPIVSFYMSKTQPFTIVRVFRTRTRNYNASLELRKT